MRSQSGGWADGEAEERPVEGRRPWRRAAAMRRAGSNRRHSCGPQRASCGPLIDTEELRLSLFILQKSFVWPFLIKLSQTLSCNGRGGSLFFFGPQELGIASATLLHAPRRPSNVQNGHITPCSQRPDLILESLHTAHKGPATRCT